MKESTAYDHSTQSNIHIPQLEWKSAFRKSFEKQSNSQYDRVSPSFFGDRRLDGLLCPSLLLSDNVFEIWVI